MFGQFFGDYLVKQNLITKSQFDGIMEYQKSIRVKLGTIAVSKELLSEEQANEINNLQTKFDKRFGDIAIEHNYLTKVQVDYLLNYQGNVYLQFTQALMDKAGMSVSEIEKLILAYQKEHNFTDDELDAIKSGDIDRITPIFLSIDNALGYEHISLALRTFIRFIDTQLLLRKSYSTKEYSFDTLACQKLVGDRDILFGFAGKDNTLLAIASPFAKEDFTEVDEDSIDSVCEFINCINGLFASKLSEDDIDIDMQPPLSYTGQKLKSEGDFYVVPIEIKGNKIDLLLSVDTNIQVVEQ